MTRTAVLSALPAALLCLAPAGCYDLEVANPNHADLGRAFVSARDVEAHVAGAYRGWHEAQASYQGVALMLSAVSFQHSTANVCEAPYAEIPRRAVENSQACIESARTWAQLYATLVTLRDGLKVLDARPDFQAQLGAAATARLRAYARFVQGLAHGSLALLYDRAAKVDEHADPAAMELLEYRELMETALAYLDEAASLSVGASWPVIPATWMSVEVAPAQLARLARSHAARLRASVARTPAERAAVDWHAVDMDADAGIAEDWAMDLDPDGEPVAWPAPALWFLFQPTRHLTQAPYFILGMADQSGSYQRWLDLPLWDRAPDPLLNGQPAPVLIVSPDTRFPRGASVAEQVANPGTMFVVPESTAPGWIRPDRGTWRWSYYRYAGAADYGSLLDTRWPVLTAAEMRLLRAEALLRNGNPAGAAALINVSRTAHGLRPTDASGTNTDCVPRLPDGTCGDLMEMLKWEKRLETYMKGPFFSSWYFDGRGWGDLHGGTFLQLPVPCSEATILSIACYTFGGEGGDWSAPPTVYRWPHEGTG